MADEKTKNAEAASAGSSERVAVPPPTKGGNKKTLIVVLAIVFLLFVLPGMIFGAFLLWFSKGDGAEKVTEAIVSQATNSEVDINADNGSFSVENEDGSVSVGNDQKLPEGFPSEIPLYPGQSVKSSYRGANDTGTAWSVTAETSDEAAKVRQHFKEEFEQWKNVGEFSINNSSTVTYERGKLHVAVQVTQDAGKSVINYTVTEDKE